MAQHYRKQGFTLAEMAIVLVVIGLLVGVVIGGSSMLQQSRLQAAVSDFSKYSSAYAQFVQQYGGPPGDIIDATNYWGKDNTYCSADSATAVSPGTCNGDGDGLLNTVTARASLDSTHPSETYRAWQQLVLANLIDGSFNGIPGTGGATHTVLSGTDTNAPKSRITNSGWSFAYKATTSSSGVWYDQGLENYLLFGASVASSTTSGALLTPSEAWQIDKKMDDSLPGTGRVLSTALTNCVSSVTLATATYTRTTTTAQCSLAMSLTLK